MLQQLLRRNSAWVPLRRELTAAVYTLIHSCKLNDVNPQTWLAFVLAKLPDHPAKAIDELLPWNWKAAQDAAVQPTPTTAAA